MCELQKPTLCRLTATATSSEERNNAMGKALTVTESIGVGNSTKGKEHVIDEKRDIENQQSAKIVTENEITCVECFTCCAGAFGVLVGVLLILAVVIVIGLAIGGVFTQPPGSSANFRVSNLGGLSVYFGFVIFCLCFCIFWCCAEIRRQDI